MRLLDAALVLAPSDLSSFLACRHRTGLDLAVARGELDRPTGADAFAATLQRLGEEHERRYVDSLRASGLTVVQLGGAQARRDGTTLDDLAAETVAAMASGAQVIVQATLDNGRWQGYADILRRVETPSSLGAWSYEVADTKLARETRGGTILQLAVYSELVGAIQGRTPERFHVVTPEPTDAGPFTVHSYRVDDYAAYYRTIKVDLEATVLTSAKDLQEAHYPEPIEACAVCRWAMRCEGRRRKDDHLSFIAGAGRSHRAELKAQGFGTLTAAAEMKVPVPFKPSRGSSEAFDRIGDQARVQHEQRTTKSPVFERLTVKASEGLCRLPAPSPGDLFLDLEGARFAREGGREYLFGMWKAEPKGSAPQYKAWWAFDDEQEKAAFEAVIDLIMAAWDADPGMHVYHFNHYEPTAFKKLMGRYVTRADELDRLLRAERFVDLYPITHQAVRAGVESYSIKKLEQYSGYTRQVELKSVSEPLMKVELALEGNAPAAITPEIRDAVQGYNEDDCRSTEVLRDWLETLRTAWVADGVPVPRPEDVPAEAPKAVAEIQKQAEEIRRRLLEAIPKEASSPAHPDHLKWLLAYLVDWHRREVNSEWWEYYRLRDLPEDELLDERKAVAGLVFVERVAEVLNKKTGKPTGSVIDRYSYPIQEIEVKGRLQLQDETTFGEIVKHDRDQRLMDVKKGKAVVDVHPSAAFAADVISSDTQQKAVMRLAEGVLAGADTLDQCGAQLLFGRRPRLRSSEFVAADGESAEAFALRIAIDLDRTVLPIQGPPGAGKTFIGAQMILGLVRAGKKVGVTATSHKVIRNLLDEVIKQGRETKQPVRIGAKPSELQGLAGPIKEFENNEDALAAIAGGDIGVLGGTSFLWAREDFTAAVDVLFVDEAGQMALANVLAVSQAANSLVLLGDPRQLDQPEKASHPDGVGSSALQHVLGEHETMPLDRGIFLPVTWRMSPTLAAFTSELFYEGKLVSKPGLERQELRGTGALDGSKLWLVSVNHDGNQSSSPEEVEVVSALVQSLLAPGSQWVDENGHAHQLTGDDLRVVAPFNAQVNRLAERLAPLGVPVGTVDKFQGQTAAVVIYSMTTSRPEDAPRGMEFLYSLNRLNVATSRARCAVFVVLSPRLVQPECRTPRQMQLANGLCRFKEMSTRY